MSNYKISDLPAVVTPSLSDLYEISQSAVSKKITALQLQTLISTAPTLAATLAVGNTTNELTINSNNSYSTLSVMDAGLTTTYIDGSDNTATNTLSPAGIASTYVDAAGNNNLINLSSGYLQTSYTDATGNATYLILEGGSGATLSYTDIAGNIGTVTLASYATSNYYADNLGNQSQLVLGSMASLLEYNGVSGNSGYVQIGEGNTAINHNIEIILQAPAYKFTNATASRIASFDSTSNLIGLSTSTYPSLTELAYVKGVTSAIQTQINAKGSGTVTTISGVASNGFTWSIANATTTPAITLTLQTASGSQSGQLSSTDWTTFNNKTTLATVNAQNLSVFATGGAIAPLTVNGVTISGSSTPTLSVTGTTSVSGSNTGDQTNVSGTAANVTGTVAIAHGGTGQTTLITAATASTIVGQDTNLNYSVNNVLEGYATTATAAGTTTLTVSSAYQQFFTGSTTQICLLPVASTLVLGQSFMIMNNSTGVLTVNSSGSNLVVSMAANTIAIVTCILISGTTAASWSVSYMPTKNILTWSSSIYFGHTALNPANATSYYFATAQIAAASTSGIGRRMPAPRTGFVYSVAIQLNIAGTLATTETATLKINNVTASTSVTVSTGIQYNNSGVGYSVVLGTPFAVTAGDSLEIEVDMPTFATKPTTVEHYVTVNFAN